jgi:hypothetical protein
MSSPNSSRTLSIVAAALGGISLLLGFFDYMPGSMVSINNVEGEAVRRSVYFAAFLGFGGLCFVTAAILHCFPPRPSNRPE